EARKYFAGAVTTAEGEKGSPVPGKLGLLLCDWRDADVPAIDAELGAVVEALPGAAKALEPEELPEVVPAACPTCGQKYKVKRDQVGRKATCRGCKGTFVLEPLPAPPPEPPADADSKPPLE